MLEKIEWYREVLELEPNSRVFFPLAKMLAESGMVEDAITTLENGLERHPEYLEARLFLIELLFANHKKEACDSQIRQLSRMFASYAGFWQAWAACLAQEPSEEDAASLLRFLAANFISGPLKLHDVINRGLQAIIEEKKQESDTSAHMEVTAARRLLEAEGELTAATGSFNDAQVISEGAETDSRPQSSLAFASKAETVEEIVEEKEEALPAPSEEEIVLEAESENPVIEKPAPEAVAFVDENNSIASAPAAETLAEMIENESEPAVSLEEGVTDTQEETLAAGLTPDLSAHMKGSTNGDEPLEAVTAEEALEEMDIPEVPVLDAEGDYMQFAPASETTQEPLTEESAYNTMIDGLAEQSQNLSGYGIEENDNIIAGRYDAQSASELDFETEAELDEIFQATEKPEEDKLESMAFDESEGQGNSSFIAVGEDSEEKISLRTRSMAEVLAEQGDVQGALDIYRELAETAADTVERDDILKRMAALQNRLDKPDLTQNGSESEKLIGMLEALAKRVEARVAN